MTVFDRVHMRSLVGAPGWLNSEPLGPRRAPPPRPHRGLEPFLFLIKRNRDGKHRWHLYNASGTIVGMHTAGFRSELEAYEDVEQVREGLAVAPIIRESDPNGAFSNAVESRWTGRALPEHATGGGK